VGTIFEEDPRDRKRARLRRLDRPIWVNYNRWWCVLS
jgi:hypothetical protein